MPKSIEQEVVDLKGQVAALEQSAAESKTALEAAQNESKQAKEALASLQANAESKDKEITALKGTVATMEADAKKASEALAEFGLKLDAGAKVNHEAIQQHVEKLASTRAVEIVGSQGSSTALNTGAPNTEAKKTEPALTGREAVKAKMCVNLSGAK